VGDVNHIAVQIGAESCATRWTNDDYEKEGVDPCTNLFFLPFTSLFSVWSDCPGGGRRIVRVEGAFS
jgi:hypothetical protein